MRIFSDSHHAGLYRSIFLLFQDRLGHEVWFPDGSMCEWVNRDAPGAWLSPNIAGNGGVPDRHLDEHGNIPNICSRDQFLEMDWDAVIITRPESIPAFQHLISHHPKGRGIKRIGQAGNESQYYDWDFVPNFLSSDYLSYVRCPDKVNKIHYMQETGRQFQIEQFVPLTQEDLRRVNTFINCLESFNGWEWDKDGGQWHGACPHCDGPAIPGQRVSVRDIWHTMDAHLPEWELRDFGIHNSKGMLNEKEMPARILEGALTWCFKTYEGMGHSIAQSISMGRLCLIPRRFHRYRTANQFLIPNITCLEAEWTPESCVNAVRWFTKSLDRANEYSEACFKASKAVFNWEHEAFRVREFMDKLQ